MKKYFLSAIDYKYAGWFLFIVLAYVVSARFGLSIYPFNTFAAPIWPPTGIALTALILGGYRYFPAVAVGAFITNASLGAPFLGALGISLGNTLEAVAGAYLVQRYVGPFDTRFGHIRSVIAFIALVGFGATFVSAFIGVTSLVVSGTITQDILQTALTWWTGDILGALVITPFLIQWLSQPYTGKTWADIGESALQILSIIAINFFIFWGSYGIAFTFLATVPLMWIAVRSGPFTTTLGIFTTVGMAIYATLFGQGPFATLPTDLGIFVLQVFSGVIAMKFLVFSAVVEERREAQRSLQKHVSELEQTLSKLASEDEAKSEFIAILAHELRNPLAAILSSAELIKIQGPDAPETPTLLETINERVRATATLLDDLLDISRISQKKFQLQKKTLLLRPIIDESVRAAYAFMNARNHTFSVVKPREDLWIDADPIRLGQIIINLLNNAAKYTEPGGKIELTVGKEGPMIAIHVKDNGIGVPRNMLGRIFEPFVQIDRNRQGNKGLGIGLSLTQKLVEMHKGTIEAKSGGEGHGAEFIVRIPLSSSSGTQKSNVSNIETPHEHRALRHAKHTKKILVVDDNEAAARALGRLLSMRGHDVELAFNGGDALKAAERFNPRVVILDIQMPDMDGYEVAHQLRERKGNAYTIIALTGFGQTQDKEKALRAGFDKHLTKPVGLKEIDAVLQKIKN